MIWLINSLNPLVFFAIFKLLGPRVLLLLVLKQADLETLLLQATLPNIFKIHLLG